MEGQVCPYCKSTTFRNPSLKIMINVCGHTLCESCVNVIFCRGSGQCPQCKTPLRRNDYRMQLFEDPMVEKELQIRKGILKYYNKKEEDFVILNDYNDYLEEIETIVNNLTNKIDVVNTNKRIDDYKRLNCDTIQRNRSRLGRDEKEIFELLVIEREQNEARRIELEQIENERKRKREYVKTTFLDELQFGNKDAGAVLNEFVEKSTKLREEEKIVTALKPILNAWKHPIYKNATDKPFKKLPKVEEGPLYVYVEPDMDLMGPKAPTMSEIESGGFLRCIVKTSVDSLAAGYCTSLACHRALQEANAGLFFKA